MTVSNRAKWMLTYFTLGITIFVLGQYIYFNKYSAYEVYINGKPLAYVKNKEDFYKAKSSIEIDLQKRFGNIILKDNIMFNNVVIKNKYLNNENSLKSIIINNSNTVVLGALMKSDGKKIAVLANEDEMKKVLDSIKKDYEKNNKNTEYRLKSHITYVKDYFKINEINTINEAIKNGGNPKNILISFYNDNEVNQKYNQKLSRSAAITNFMFSPAIGIITSPFGIRWGKMHNGIDIGSSMGQSIFAAMDGKVSCTEWEDGYGNVIKIDHGEGVQTLYAHCSSIDVKVGQYVKRGEKIGEVGSTGRSTGPHVHFEVRVDGTPQNPLNYLK
ncbi:peptidoglycan DD-metalloendopeptidase family protein [Clostridium sp. DJ247]|uniref:peptidoglycan DD-metalloendopeptidase family protein n=1 Tax=Clostridium sp. DJ247 TaxID=2726188 RepID=UPI00162A4D4C|nr:peptidoglycan DD-metalloendopeptidase family protein [Clostridium sp. DJ247]MBC2580942.1 peptidoglycan DD-metalloendopeptidase family protein [Clostridium sp. DJ247]